MYIGITINVHRYSCKVPAILTEFNETCIPLTDFKMSSDIKFDDILWSGSRVVPRGQTDTHVERNSRFSEFCKRA